MTIEHISLHLETEESRTPLLDQLAGASPRVAEERPLLERAVGFDGALIKNVQGQEVLGDQMPDLIIKASRYIGTEALKAIELEDDTTATNADKVEAIVDELIAAEYEATLPLANSILREKVVGLKDQLDQAISPDYQFLYNELENLQKTVDAQKLKIASLESTLGQERVKLADKDVVIDVLRNTAQGDEVAQSVSVENMQVAAFDDAHTITDEFEILNKRIIKPVRNLGARVLVAVGLALR